jgi:hypothetical protein
MPGSVASGTHCINERNTVTSECTKSTPLWGFYIMQRHCSITTNYVVGLLVNIQKHSPSVGSTDAVHLPFFVERFALNLLWKFKSSGMWHLSLGNSWCFEGS